MFQYLLLSILCSKNRISQCFLELNLYHFKSFSWHCIWGTAAYICLKSDNTCKSLDISFLHILSNIQISFHISIHISSTWSDITTFTKSSRRNETQYLIYSWVDALIDSKVFVCVLWRQFIQCDKWMSFDRWLRTIELNCVWNYFFVFYWWIEKDFYSSFLLCT